MDNLTNEYYEKVFNELKKNCPCLKDVDLPEFINQLNNFLSFLSSLLCWDINNGSLLVEEREQEIELSGNLCDYGCLEIQPYFKFIDDKTFEVELLTIDNGDITTKKLTNFVYQKGLDLLLVNPAEGKDCCCRCECSCSCNKGCKRNILVIRYKAGIDLLRPDLLPLLCHYFTAFTALASKCCNLDDCCNMDRLAVGSYLKSKKIDLITYTWDIDKNSKEYLLNDMINKYYLKALGKYALCGRDLDYDYNIWVGQNENKIQRKDSKKFSCFL